MGSGTSRMGPSPSHLATPYRPRRRRSSIRRTLSSIFVCGADSREMEDYPAGDQRKLELASKHPHISPGCGADPIGTITAYGVSSGGGLDGNLVREVQERNVEHENREECLFESREAVENNTHQPSSSIVSTTEIVSLGEKGMDSSMSEGSSHTRGESSTESDVSEEIDFFDSECSSTASDSPYTYFLQESERVQNRQGGTDISEINRWHDLSSDLFSHGRQIDIRSHRNRNQGGNEQWGNSASEIFEGMDRRLNSIDNQTAVCPRGIHANGSCSCQPISAAEESAARAGISRVVLLAEALLEVLDHIYRQPLMLSLSVISLPAPDSIVDSFPVKVYRKSEHSSECESDVSQCYICLDEYEEGDKIRVLPCLHEYHMSCVDKWLKEVHGVCPLCRRDVCEGLTESSVSDEEVVS